jgi:hypothetical protein
MKRAKLSLQQRLLLSGGLLIITTIILLGHYLKMAAPLQGFFIGIGLGLEIAALITIKKTNKGSGALLRVSRISK